MIPAILILVNLAMAALNLAVGNHIIAGISIGAAGFILCLEILK